MIPIVLNYSARPYEDLQDLKNSWSNRHFLQSGGMKV